MSLLTDRRLALARQASAATGFTEKKWSERQDSNLSIGGKNKEKSSGDAQRDAQKLAPSIAELKQVIIAWPKLTAPLKAAILAIVKSVEGVQ